MPTNGCWACTLAFSLLLFVGSLGLIEARIRSLGYKRQYPWHEDMWTHQRLRLDSLPDDQTVLIGASRMQFGMSLDEWEEQTGERPLMLAWPGAPPAPVLADLADMESYRGTVVCSVAPGFVFAAEQSSPVTKMEDLVDRTPRQRFSLSYQGTQTVRLFLHDHLRFLNPDAFSPIHLCRRGLDLPNRENLELPLLFPPAFYWDRDIQISIAPEVVSDAVLRKEITDVFVSNMEMQRLLGSCDVEGLIERMTRDVRKIEARGGKVIWVRFPSTDGYLEFETAYYSRQKCWDRIIESTGCLGVHYADHPELRRFVPPEWSHLMPDDAVAFTRRFIEIVEREAPAAIRRVPGGAD